MLKDNYSFMIGALLSVLFLSSTFLIYSNKEKEENNFIQTESLKKAVTRAEEVKPLEKKDSVNENQKIEININNIKKMNGAIIKTNKGNIEISFSEDKPLTTDNFKKLVSGSFYNGVKFHRVIRGFMIQTGDPQSKDDTLVGSWGTGGPGYKFNDELTGKETYERGVVAMANSGQNTNGSQFFIMTGEGVRLPPSYTVFGKVTSGIETALAIQEVETNQSDRPLDAVIIESITLK
jgi:cyclophilin family peptidyl-prolyl cis-trans isomerase